jgi:hypothetical protein
MSSVFEWYERFKEAHMSKLQMKTMLITFFDIKGAVHFEFIPQGQTELWPNDCIFHHDNVPAHKLYSPDLTPNDFWLFPKIKSALKGRVFHDTEDVEKM